MKKYALLALSLLVGSHAFASTLSCTAGSEDSYREIEISDQGSIVVSFYESALTFTQEDVQIIKTAADDQSPTQIYTVNNKIVRFAGEGQVSQVPATLVFVYNPLQRAGRMTVIAEGHTFTRNELLSNCKLK